MKDKQIRPILKEWILTQDCNARIYEEKAIGASVCDVMAVTDVLSGYEIKSDADDLRRLKRQEHHYTCMFQYCWLVVGETQVKHAQEILDRKWGILCVRDDNLTVIRQARRLDTGPYRPLHLLWKTELKNLLIKNGLPLYAQKSKEYIRDRLLEAVDKPTLFRQITEELHRRDSEEFGHIDYDEFDNQQNGMFHTGLPMKEIVDVLSEKDLSEFTLDKWIALYRQAKAVQAEKEAAFQAPVAPRVKHAIPYTDIEVRPGVPWIDKLIIEDFLRHLLEQPYPFAKGDVCYEAVTGAWHIKNKDWLLERSVLATTRYGLPRYNALQILEAILNLREIKLYDNGTVYNERDTLAALEKQNLILEEFQRWIWQDEDRREQIEAAYNAIFSSLDPKTYDGSGLHFDRMSPECELFDYQKDAVDRILKEKNTLLAFDVGAGKTFIMIAAAMKMRQMGMSRKNMFVVPNHIVGQWEQVFTQLYPDAKVLAVEPSGFRPDMRRKILEQIRQGDYDGIIMAYSCFEMIPLSEDAVVERMNERLKKIDNAVEGLKYRIGGYSCLHWGDAPLRKEWQHIRKATKEFLDSMKERQTLGVTFEDLEITTLFLDEAHNYKNLPIRTNMRHLTGIHVKGSDKCMDMLHKVRSVQRNGRGAVFATGTPLCNSITDAYVMQLYLQPELLEKHHLEVFDNWVKTFARPEQLMEIDVDASKFRMIRKFTKFHNLPELSKMFACTAIFYSAANRAFLPTVEGYTDVVIERFPLLEGYMAKLCERTEAIRSKKVAAGYDNMLKVSTDGRKAALDLKLVGEAQPEAAFSKVCQCVERVTALLKEYPTCTQLIFCDCSTPKPGQYSVYKELKERLTAAGVPAKEIAFIHDYQNETRKVELYRKFNAGEVRVLIGSTFKLGTGANVQVKLKAVHHLDVPWRPADMQQREGRLVRRGNENEQVFIYRYIAQGSFDSYSWQVLETKQRFIAQFLSGTSYQRTADDLEQAVLTYSEVKALALSDPRMKDLAETENEIRRLLIVMAKEKETRERLQKEAAKLKEDLPRIKRRLETTARFEQELSRFTSEDFKAAHRLFGDRVTTEMIDGSQSLPKDLELLGFTICAPEVQDEKKPYWYLCREEERYKVEIGSSVSGNATRIVTNRLGKFDRFVQQVKEDYDRAVLREREITALLETPSNGYEKELQQAEKKAAELKTAIQAGA